MARLILKCPYFKGGSRRASAHLGNLVNYIATRDGVEKILVKDKNTLSSEKQDQLINQIIKEFPNTKNLFEYEDYIKNPTIENASELISIAVEENFDKIGKRKNYVDYISNRPGVERIVKHGLFTGGEDSLVLSRIADEVANHEGNVWTPIISLRREDAIRLGFDNAESWHNLLSYYAIDIAEALKIKAENFQWYAAFHNEGHHPHVHMVCYSTDPREGYLTKKGIEKMKSGFVKNIFGQELKEIYIEQSKRRDQLKEESREVLLQLISEMKNNRFQNDKVEELFIEFAKRLKSSKGKKLYGYLQPNLKVMVDEIVDELSKDERISKAYDLWYEMRNEVLNSYMDNLPEPIPLSKQKEFKSIKNMIIKEADNYNKGIFAFEEINSEDVVITDELMNTDIDDLVEEATNGNQYAQFSLGKFYLTGEGVIRNKEEAKKWLGLSAEQGNEYAKVFLYNIDRIYNQSVSQIVSRMFHHMSKIFEDNIPLQTSKIGKKIDSKLLRKLREKKMAQGHKNDYEQERAEL
ncbi:hypothetical protein SAMN02745784_02189 [Tissierella praeacuta DSM 18095]|uniref:Sel1 repeat-containing protein n=1 Tax=Tissierella praeacuta DSM 18095 TaxID=1123404 RepID=A0A1M4XAQ4_9FIRM|nr:MobP3 family relaxase [Tissierella praeacuta]SHE90577.1 hypothetical protein SAMN02745784_02189 [Tissierella praeacuta DSM 18095]SUP02585.1 Sel1 repeat [Tissierella praeacuta]